MSAELAQADLISAPSEFVRDQMIASGLDAAKIVFCENGLDEAPFARLAARSAHDRIVGRPVRFGFIGTLIPNKGPELLVRAFQRLPADHATLDVWGQGGGPGGATYERRLKGLNHHPAVRFHGRFDNAKIADVLATFDVIVVPSLWWENAPLTLAEAAAAGLPAICAGHGGMAEFARRFGSAVTFSPGDIDDLERALRRFLDEPGLFESLRPKRPVRTSTDDVRAWEAQYARIAKAR